MTDEVNEFYKGLNIDLEIVVKGLSFFIDSPEAHMCYTQFYLYRDSPYLLSLKSPTVKQQPTITISHPIIGSN